jgi:hypothetical protein
LFSAFDSLGRTGTFNPRSGSLTTTGKARKPALSHESLSGIANGKPKLAFTLTAAKNAAAVTTVMVSLPTRLAFSNRSKTLAKGISVTSTAGKKLDFVFTTRMGGPLRQRNVQRALRIAQRAAVDEHGRPTFPVLHQTDENGKPTPISHGELPSMHSFRHTVASRVLVAGESVDESAFLLGHRDARFTCANLRARVVARCGARA